MSTDKSHPIPDPMKGIIEMAHQMEDPAHRRRMMEKDAERAFLAQAPTSFIARCTVSYQAMMAALG